jgi:hypothetical protein
MDLKLEYPDLDEEAPQQLPPLANGITGAGSGSGSAQVEMEQAEIDAIIRNKRKARDPKACYACHRRKVKVRPSMQLPVLRISSGIILVY